MKWNLLIFFLFIVVLGIGLIFFLLVKGNGDVYQIVSGGESKNVEKEIVNVLFEEIYKVNCIICYGENYEGVLGLNLKGVGKRKDVAVIKIRIEKGGNGMFVGFVLVEKLDDMVKWVFKIK